MKVYGGVETRVYISTGRGRSAPGTHFIGGRVDPRTSKHEVKKKNLHPSDTRDRIRAVQPVAKRLAA